MIALFPSERSDKPGFERGCKFGGRSKTAGRVKSFGTAYPKGQALTLLGAVCGEDWAGIRLIR